MKKIPRLRDFFMTYSFNFGGAPGRNRTHDPLVRSQVLYPAELLAHCCLTARTNYSTKKYFVFESGFAEWANL